LRGHAGAGRDELADDDVLLQTRHQAVVTALDGGLGEHPGGLLEATRPMSHESVASDALVMPISSGRPSAGLALGTRRGWSRNVWASTRSPGRNVGVARLLNGHAPGHLPHDQLDVLVVDRHALVAVHLLYLVDQVLLRGVHALMSMSSFGSRGPSTMASPAVIS
jgi:hypothetical protein